VGLVAVGIDDPDTGDLEWALAGTLAPKLSTATGMVRGSITSVAIQDWPT
jgi:hypothetical protein